MLPAERYGGADVLGVGGRRFPLGRDQHGAAYEFLGEGGGRALGAGHHLVGDLLAEVEAGAVQAEEAGAP
ncbi:hypothetical protein AB0I98_42650 [Streptomyces sp. NPDC050211]|uniref:hypothetical protein n=1 Tax=Streptomyces sp. NPDC050211 TaxID=3154932 RepID=UPI0034430D67